MMKKKIAVISCFLFAMSLASCSFPVGTTAVVPNQEIIGQYQTVSVLLTQTSQRVQVNTPVPPTRAPDFSPSLPAPTRTYTPVMNSIQATTARPGALVVPCEQARAGMPFDVSIPDDTRLHPGEYFSKTWRLVNAGSCTWDRGYAVMWFSGDDLGVTRTQGFNGIVMPGQAIDVTVDMQAPETPGVYQSNWKLRSNQGSMFGIGPGGGAPFWVRIVVIPVDTETPMPSALPPTPTLAPEVYSSGAVDLPLDMGLDLDSGSTNQILNDDLRLIQTTTGQAQLAPENGAGMASYGRIAPEFADCDSLSPSTTPIYLDQMQPGAYLCFRTTEGLPGWVVLTSVDESQSQVTLEFVTWAVP